VSHPDETALRERLQATISSLPVPPPPLAAVRSRGRAVRNRRRGATAAGLALLAGVTAVVVALPALLTAGPVTGPRVTMNTPTPGAPGGVFASGTAGGRPWQLALRNIAGPGSSCLPAVMLNGSRGDLLSPGRGGAASPGYPAFLTLLPGQPDIGYGFVQTRPGATGVVATLADGRQVAARPVPVALCGRRFSLAGFAFAGAAVTKVATQYADGAASSYPTPYVPFPAAYHAALPFRPYGMWENTGPYLTRAELTRPVASGIVAQGRISGTSWRIQVNLGAGTGSCASVAAGQTTCWGGECYRTYGLQTMLGSCLPVTAPPARVALLQLILVALLQRAAGKHSAAVFIGYAGQVSPRAAYLIARFADGSSQRIVPATVAGRRYIAFVMRQTQRVKSLTLYTGAGVRFAVVSSLPVGCVMLPVPTCGPLPSNVSATSAYSVSR
jgi:hypothetical protein